MASRLCTAPDCSTELTGAQKLYCSNACKSRAQRAKRADAAAAHKADLPDPTPDQVARAMQEELQNQLAPVIRENLTDDVVKAAEDMVKLSGKAVAALKQDLESTDPNIRQRAYALWLKYTVGSQAVMPNLTDDSQSPMTVVIANMPATVEPAQPPPEELPRRDPEAPALPPPTDAELQDLRECDTCHTFKPDSQFEASSSRCTDCFDRLRSQALATFGESASGSG